MKHSVRFLLTGAALLFLTGNAFAADVNIPPAVEKALESRVVVGVSFFGQRGAVGTGFIAAPGYIITAAHLFSDVPPTLVEKLPVLIGKSLKDDDPQRAKVVLRDILHDLAVLKVEETGKFGPPATLAGNFPADGETIYYSGFWEGSFNATLKAVVLGKKESVTIHDTTIMGTVIIDRAIPPGFSGGPVFNANGELVGMNSFATQAGNLGGIIPLEPIRNILKEIK